MDSLAAEFKPEEYHDPYRDHLRTMIEARIAGREVAEAPVIDIMEALKRSLEMRKPPQTASEVVETAAEEEAPRKKRVGGRRSAAG